jgi:(p)ppGpp synthase/HD superfamily hydrolase
MKGCAMNDTIRIAQALDFAARKHIDQRRKGAKQEPYLNHLAEVARLLAEATGGEDANLVIAGLLHDTIEDQEVKYEELMEAFGKDVADLVREVTDNKALPKPERKRLQVETAPKKSARAKMIKIADKTSNLRSMQSSPPAHWDAERRRAYLLWAAKVVAGCRGVNPMLEDAFDAEYQGAAAAGLL